jgi:hypothetical protein
MLIEFSVNCPETEECKRGNVHSPNVLTCLGVC